jgi:hypothetical protein
MIVVTLGGVNSRHAKTVTHPASRAGEVINALIDAGYKRVSETGTRLVLSRGGSIATITVKGG